MSLKEINLKGSYTGKGEKILNDFLMPSLKHAIEYDRITGYYTIDSLLSIANGIESIRKKKRKDALNNRCSQCPRGNIRCDHQ